MKKYYVKFALSVFFIFVVFCLCISLVYCKTGLEWGEDGDDYYAQGNYEKAIGCYKEALKEYPNSSNLYYNIGNCYLKLKKYDKAIEYYEICLDKNPSHELAPGKIKEAKRLKEEASFTPTPTRTPTLVPTPTRTPTLVPTLTPTPIPIVPSISSEMEYIQGGVFEMGSNMYDWEQPVHTVEVSNFYMGKYEVMNKEYRQFAPGHSGKWSNDNYAVENVSWYDAVNYCNWLSDKEGFERCYSGSGDDIVCNFSKNGYRLPTEAEWEYACRAGTITEYYWGDEMNGNYCWYGDNSGNQLHPVGQKKSNQFGLYDIWDWYDESYYSVSPCSNPAGPSSGVFRVVRGGSWSDCARKCRSAERGGGSPAYCLYTPGFRPVRRD